MNKMWIVIKEVYRKNVMSPSFIMMILGPILMIAVIGLIAFFGSRMANDNSIGTIGIVNAKPEIQQVFEEDTSGNDYVFYDEEESARKALADEDVHGFLVIKSDTDVIQATYYRESTSRDIDVSTLQSLLQQYQTNHSLENAGINPELLASIQAQNVDVPSVNLTFGESGQATEQDVNSEKQGLRTAIAYIVCFVIYMFIMTYISLIVQEIAMEKGSRIMEIVLSSISATQHFFSKMIGIILVILTQIGAYAAMLLIGKVVLEQLNMGQEWLNSLAILPEVMQESGRDILFGALYALLGILIYISLAGFLGSLASRIEDAGKSTMPLVLLGIVGFYIGMFALNSTNNALVRISSHIPFFTPFVMPFRLATDTVSNMEIIMSVIISLLFMVLCLFVSATFYKSNVLATSDKGLIQTFKRSYQLWKSERSLK